MTFFHSHLHLLLRCTHAHTTAVLRVHVYWQARKERRSNSPACVCAVCTVLYCTAMHAEEENVNKLLVFLKLVSQL